MSTPRSIRFETGVTQRLSSYVARHPGLSASSVAARLVDEGLRMDEHPGVVFRDGAAGRRAGLVAGPDVWEVVRAVRSARAAEPDLDETALLAMLATHTGLPPAVLRIAVGYWSAYPDEVEALIAHADDLEVRGLAQQAKVDSLLR
ncbi:MAG: hypothetical protein Q8R60_07500 [Mycobacteriales bacterium]|nr:hypothetical protein [Mycobacteriales bacterium]